MGNRKTPQTLVQLTAAYRHPDFSNGVLKARLDVLHNYQITREVAERKIADASEDSQLYYLWCELREECLAKEKSCKKTGLPVEKLRQDYDNFSRSVKDWFELEDPSLVPHVAQAL